MAQPCKALVLAGGGAKGSYQVGAYRALQQLDWKPELITGASVGALNGAMLAMGKVEELEELWRSLDLHDVIELPESLAPEQLREYMMDVVRAGGLDVEPLAETVEALLDEEVLRASDIGFGLVMTAMDTMQSVPCPLQEIPEGQLKDYLMASSACFPALRPREIDGKRYIDGGWRDNMPLELAARMGATELLAIDVDGIGIVRPNHTGLPTKIIRSHWDLGPTLDFDPERAMRNMALGYFDTMRAFGRMGGTAYGILPDEDDFLPKFAQSYQLHLAQACARAPELAMTERAARQRGGYPPAFAQNLLAPTRGALAPLELAAERLGVSPEMPYTPKLLALTFMGSYDKDPAERFATLLDGKEGSLVGERAMAVAAPEEFMVALVSRALADVTVF